MIDPENQDDWDEHLEPIMSAYRAVVHDSTGISPYFMVYHKEPRLPVDIEHGQATDPLEEQTSPIIHDADTYQRYATTMMEVKRWIADKGLHNIKKAQDRQEANYYKRHTSPGRQGGKMDSTYTGPFEITHDIGKGVYGLRNLKANKTLAKTYNSTRFKVYFSDDATPTTTPTPTHTATHTTTPTKRKADIPLPKRHHTDYWKQDLNLHTADRDVILELNQLNDRHLDAASTLLRRQFPTTLGLQSTLLTKNKDNWNHVGSEHDSVQLLHDATRQHWLVAEMRDGQLFLHDSLQSSTKTALTADVYTSISN